MTTCNGCRIRHDCKVHAVSTPMPSPAPLSGAELAERHGFKPHGLPPAQALGGGRAWVSEALSRLESGDDPDSAVPLLREALKAEPIPDGRGPAESRVWNGCGCVCRECLRYAHKTHTVCIYSCALRTRTTDYRPETSAPMPSADDRIPIAFNDGGVPTAWRDPIASERAARRATIELCAVLSRLATRRGTAPR